MRVKPALLAMALAAAPALAQTVAPLVGNPQAVQPVNDGCSPGPPLAPLHCSMLPGTRTYQVTSGYQYVYLVNRTGRTISITRVKTICPWGTWCEMSAYYNFLGTCSTAPDMDHCPGANLPPGQCPCMKDLDPGPGLNLVGAIGNMFEDGTRQVPDLTWGDGFSVPPDGYYVLGDNVHGEGLGTMYQVTVEDRAANDLAIRQPLIDNVIRCDGKKQATVFDPVKADADMTLTGVQVYASQTAAPRTSISWACVYVFDGSDWDHPLWFTCSKALATTDTSSTGNVKLNHEVKAGQYIVWHANNTCPAGHVWDGVGTITAKRRVQ